MDASERDLQDKLALRGDVVVRCDRAPGPEMRVPGNGMGARPGYRISDERRAHIIYREIGENIDMSDIWRTGGPARQLTRGRPDQQLSRGRRRIQEMRREPGSPGKTKFSNVTT